MFYSDIPKWEMTPGQAATFLCINIEDNYITFIPHNDVNNDFIELNEIITKYTDTNTEPYSPILDELCLAKYEGSKSHYRPAFPHIFHYKIVSQMSGIVLK